MSHTAERPYLSVVVVSRNDNHGGDLLLRTQAFLNNLAALAARHQVSTELVLVEWNPPAGRGSLADVLDWPESGGWCDCRVIQVPPALHARLRHSEHLPLFQMIGKNVGVRRARGRFVLATNIDLLFSDELFEYLGRKPLRKGRYYRVDRYDVPTEVAAIRSVDDQLAYCANAVLRVNAKFGILSWDEWCRYSRHKVRWWLGKCGDYALAQAERCGRRLGRLVRRPLELAAEVRNYVRVAGMKQTLLHRAPTIAWKLCKAAAIGMATSPQRLALEARRRLRRGVVSATMLHTNACGDFTLLAREDWRRLRGYAEFEIFSWHLDSLLIYSAFHGGAKEVVLGFPVYHIEHSGGWKPDAAEALWRRLDEKRIAYLTNDDLFALRMQIIASGGKHVFNTEQWGLAAEDLPERILCAGGHALPAPHSSLLETSTLVSRGQAA